MSGTQAEKPDSDHFIQPKIQGYRQLTKEDADLINEIKGSGEALRQLIAKLEQRQADPRWLSIARTDLQKGYMALTRAVAKPDGF